MADRSSQLMLAALSRAAAEPSNVPLFASRTASGLFPATTAGKQAAQRCRDEGYLDANASITDRGLTYLLSQVSPKPVLEDFVRAIESREQQLTELGTQICSLIAGLEAMRGRLGQVLTQLDRQADLNGLCRQFHEQPTTDPSAVALKCVSSWKGPDDMPLPDLYEQVSRQCAGLSIGAFHDLLRVLEQQGRIALHPWTGPLYEVPQPRYALLTGHQIGYYASPAVKE